MRCLFVGSVTLHCHKALDDYICEIERGYLTSGIMSLLSLPIVLKANIHEIIIYWIVSHL